MHEGVARIQFSLGKSPILPTEEQNRQRIRSSIERCETKYGLDRRSTLLHGNVLTSCELSRARDREASFLRIASPALGWLHQQIGALGFCSLLTDREGVALDLRVAERFGREFHDKGLKVGACWSEKVQGTSGVGTAIADKLPTVVSRKDHFFSRNQDINCFAVPIFGRDNEILGILNATGLAENSDRGGFSVAYNLSQLAVTQVEQSLFYETHLSDWVVRLATQPELWAADQAILIACDESGRVLGVSRNLASQIPSNLLARDLNVEDIIDVSFDRLRNYAFANPGTPLTIRSQDNISSLRAEIKAPRTKAKALRTDSSRPAKLAEFESPDPKMSENHARLKRLANKKIPILLLGETGAGKEQTARSLHRYSLRADKPFVAINCAAIPESLIESELFGYKEGAFTGANAKGSIGKIAQANGGTLFLDEIGDMPLALQTRLLRVLSEGELLALGAITPESVDLAVICATHRDLPMMVKEGLFREDLFYRLNAATFRIPPLRERKDIANIIGVVFSEEKQDFPMCKTLSCDVENTLCGYSWPGNFRELRNTLRYALAVCDSDEVTLDHLPESFSTPILKAVSLEPKTDSTAIFIENKNEKQRDELVNSLRVANWSATTACLSLGISRATLYRRMKKFGVVTPNILDSAAFSLSE